MKFNTTVSFTFATVLLLVSQAHATSGNSVALFWNVEFDNRLQTEYQNYNRNVERKQKGNTLREERTTTDYGNALAREDEGMTQTVNESFQGRRVLNDRSRRALDPSANARLESALISNLQQQGMRVMDRTMLLRLSSRNLASHSNVNVQALEATAVNKGAATLLQVLLEEDQTSPIGTRFNVRVIDAETAELLVSLSTLALPRQTPTIKWRATDRGYERETILPPISYEGVGERLAREIAALLSG